MSKRFFAILSGVSGLVLSAQTATAIEYQRKPVNSYRQGDAPQVARRPLHVQRQPVTRMEPAPAPRTQPRKKPPVDAVEVPWETRNLQTAEPQFHVYFDGGWSNTGLIWNIGYPQAINGSFPNILSELTWNDVHSTHFSVGGEYTGSQGWFENVMLLGKLHFGAAYDGRNQDSDWINNDRNGEFSRSNNDADADLRGFSAGLGYRIGMEDRDRNIGFSLTPVLGYTYEAQDFSMGPGTQTLSDGVLQTVPVGTQLTGLDSSYEAEWDGPYAEIQAKLKLFGRHELRASGSYFYADYQGTGHWNLRADLADPSFEHFSDGAGRRFGVGYSFWITPKWELRLDAQYETWKAGQGGSITYFSNGTASGAATFNNAKWQAQRYTAGFGYSF